jgi:hypothetical protein
VQRLIDLKDCLRNTRVPYSIEPNKEVEEDINDEID